jgi:hypothetical protein
LVEYLVKEANDRVIRLGDAVDIEPHVVLLHPSDNRRREVYQSPDP